MVSDNMIREAAEIGARRMRNGDKLTEQEQRAYKLVCDEAEKRGSGLAHPRSGHGCLRRAWQSATRIRHSIATSVRAGFG